MDGSVDTDGDTLSKSDDNRKSISQKSAKFSIDSLLSTTESVRSDPNVIEDVQCSDFTNYSKTNSSNLDCEVGPSHGQYSELSSSEECVRKENEIVSTTDGFYQRRFSEGK